MLRSTANAKLLKKIAILPENRGTAQVIARNVLRAEISGTLALVVEALHAYDEEHEQLDDDRAKDFLRSRIAQNPPERAALEERLRQAEQIDQGRFLRSPARVIDSK